MQFNFNLTDVPALAQPLAAIAAGLVESATIYFDMEY